MTFNLFDWSVSVPLASEVRERFTLPRKSYGCWKGVSFEDSLASETLTLQSFRRSKFCYNAPYNLLPISLDFKETHLCLVLSEVLFFKAQYFWPSF